MNIKTEDEVAKADNKAGANTPQNKKTLADLLGVSVFILNKMIEAVKDELGNPVGTRFSVKQVQFMVHKYGIMRK